jgi:predicted transcriptional regulator
MPRTATRVNIVLDDERAAKLKRLAERTHTNAGTLARSLLSTALDEADPDPRNVTDVLDRIDGAWADAMRGLAEARAGAGVPLGEI